MSSFLLDTHIWLWMLADSPRLRPRTRAILEDDTSELFLSVASVWEISVKANAGKLEIPVRTGAEFTEQLRLTRVTALPIDVAHAAAAGQLARHHADPFDRVIVAQAQALTIPIITVDRALSAYDVALIDD